jgi:4'-phosphopantetheinyl transferase EntD
MRVPKRAADFRLGRWTAKQALQRAFGARDWTIVPREDGSPEAFADGAPADVSLSISHAAGHALVSVAAGACALGCDVERIEPRDEALVREFFEDSERSFLDLPEASRGGLSREAAVTVLWSAKESALKAHRVGLRADPRGVVVKLDFSPDAEPREEGFLPLRVRFEGRVLVGTFQVDEGFARTVVADPWGAPLVSLSQRETNYALRSIAYERKTRLPNS